MQIASTFHQLLGNFNQRFGDRVPRKDSLVEVARLVHPGLASRRDFTSATAFCANPSRSCASTKCSPSQFRSLASSSTGSVYLVRVLRQTSPWASPVMKLPRRQETPSLKGQRYRCNRDVRAHGDHSSRHIWQRLPQHSVPAIAAETVIVRGASKRNGDRRRIGSKGLYQFFRATQRKALDHIGSIEDCARAAVFRSFPTTDCSRAQIARAATPSWRRAAASEAMYSPIASGNGGYAGKIRSIRISLSVGHRVRLRGRVA